MNHAPYFTGMSHSAAADALAHYQGELQALDDARDAYAEQYATDTLAELKRDPMGYSRKQCFSGEFYDWLYEQPDQMEQAQSRGLAQLVTATDAKLNELRIAGFSALADMATLLRDRYRDHLLTQGAEKFDEKMRKGPEVDCE